MPSTSTACWLIVCAKLGRATDIQRVYRELEVAPTESMDTEPAVETTPCRRAHRASIEAAFAAIKSVSSPSRKPATGGTTSISSATR